MTTMTRRKIVLTVLSVLVFVALCAITQSARGQWVEVNGNRYWVRLTEFHPPVHVGMKAPPVPWRHKALLRDVQKALNFIDLDVEEARLLTDRPERIAEEIVAWRERLKSSPESLTFFQCTVEYVIEVKVAQNPTRYLLVCGQNGLNAGPSDSPHGLPCSFWERHDGRWRSCAKDPVPRQVARDLPIAKIEELRQLVR